MLPQDVLVDPRLVVEALLVAERGELHEVVVSLQILGQQEEMEIGSIFRALAIGARPRRDIGLHADDRLDAFSFAFAVELESAEHIAVIRQGQRVHVVVLGLGDELLY